MATPLFKRFIGESGFSREAIVVKPFKKLAASVAFYRVDLEEVEAGIDKTLQNKVVSMVHNLDRGAFEFWMIILG